MRQAKELIFDSTIYYLDAIHRTAQLTAVLPSSRDQPNWLMCRKCGHHLGCLSNSRGIIFGQFDQKDYELSDLVCATVIQTKRVELICGNCGQLFIWHRTDEKRR
ncbi:hypothetical protein Mal52_30500 [Symmachiella dynata]|uniref:Uncharacterized protein n=1 Tax=Symmachiella dynata TaxID=2527995 RepID=A0A517ZQ00_9PLAN|nr:hypothetical protein Mal52_30500 [Symmachiella dynata]